MNESCHEYVGMRLVTNMCVCVHVYICVRVCIHICVYTYRFEYIDCQTLFRGGGIMSVVDIRFCFVHKCDNLYVYICTYICIYKYMCIYI